MNFFLPQTSRGILKPSSAQSENNLFPPPPPNNYLGFALSRKIFPAILVLGLTPVPAKSSRLPQIPALLSLSLFLSPPESNPRRPGQTTVTRDAAEPMEEEIRAEFESSGFSIGGADPGAAAEILSTRTRASPPFSPDFLSSFFFFDSSVHWYFDMGADDAVRVAVWFVQC